MSNLDKANNSGFQRHYQALSPDVRSLVPRILSADVDQNQEVTASELMEKLRIDMRKSVVSSISILNRRIMQCATGSIAVDELLENLSTASKFLVEEGALKSVEVPSVPNFCAALHQRRT